MANEEAETIVATEEAQKVAGLRGPLRLPPRRAALRDGEDIPAVLLADFSWTLVGDASPRQRDAA